MTALQSNRRRGPRDRSLDADLDHGLVTVAAPQPHPANLLRRRYLRRPHPRDLHIATIGMTTDPHLWVIRPYPPAPGCTSLLLNEELSARRCVHVLHHQPAPGSARNGPVLTTERVWHQIEKASFAVISYVTPAGRPRSSGVGFAAQGRRLYVVTAAASWKARQLSDGDEVAVTVPICRGGLLSLVAPIPPATVSFHATVTVHPAGSFSLESVPEELVSHLPAERRRDGCLLELVPGGDFLAYGLGVSLLGMTKPQAALAHVPVS